MASSQLDSHEYYKHEGNERRACQHRRLSTYDTYLSLDTSLCLIGQLDVSIQHEKFINSSLELVSTFWETELSLNKFCLVSQYKETCSIKGIDTLQYSKPSSRSKSTKNIRWAMMSPVIELKLQSAIEAVCAVYLGPTRRCHVATAG